MTLKRLLPLVACGALVFGSVAWGEDAPKPPPATPPATQPSANVSPEAKEVLDQVGAAYGKVKSLELAGAMSVEVEVPEQHVNRSTTFTAAFSAPNKFRHEMKDDILLGSTGQKLFVFKADENAYISVEAPRDRVAGVELPRDISDLLELQDPSLLLAMSKDPVAALLKDAADVTKVPDVTLDSTAYPALKVAMKDKSVVTLLLDPRTHLIKQAKTDATAVYQQRRADLTVAVMTVDYTKTSTGADKPDEQFAWAPPDGARDASASIAMLPGDDLPPEVAALVGKPAPTFKLTTLDGKDVSLESLKGHVVILDFWATWCGPCRTSLPGLNKIYEELKDKGLHVYAVDLQEDKSDVQDAVKEMKLTLPVVIDAGEVAQKYGVSPIPQTVIIGKDGKVLKAFVGAGPDTEEEIRGIVADAMKK